MTTTIGYNTDLYTPQELTETARLVARLVSGMKFAEPEGDDFDIAAKILNLIEKEIDL